MYGKEVNSIPSQRLLRPVVVRLLLQALRLCLWEVHVEGKWSQIWVVTVFSLSWGSSWAALSQMGGGLTEEKANRTNTASGFPGWEHTPYLLPQTDIQDEGTPTMAGGSLSTLTLPEKIGVL